MSELGWIEGRTVAIEVRWAEGRSDHAAEIAADFVRLEVDVVVTTGTPTTLAAKQATAVIPIVFVAASDPVAGNLVASLARPGGNMTGLFGGGQIDDELELGRLLDRDVGRLYENGSSTTLCVLP